MKTELTTKHFKTLRNLAENGFIVHNAHNSEEWLTDMEEEWIFLGIGRTSDWKNAQGVSYDEEIEFPGDNDSTDIYPGYFQKNADVLNPVGCYGGWENDFETIGDSIRYKNTY